MARKTQGNKWQAVWRVPSPDGSWVQKTRVFKLKSEAVAHEVKMKEQLKGPRYVEPTRETVAQYMERWLALTKPFIQPTTYYNYSAKTRLYIIPRLGAHRLALLTPRLVEEWLGGLYTLPGAAGGQLSQSSVAQVFAILKIALNNAVERNELQDNPCNRIPRRVRPTQQEREIIPLSEAEIQTLIEGSRGTDPGTMFLAGLLCGLRAGEVAALRWRHLDFNAGVMHVEESRKTVGPAQYATGKPKFDGTRSIAMPGLLVESLQAHRIRQLEARLKAPHWEDNDLVFPGSYGQYRHKSDISKTLRRWLVRLGLRRVRFHDLRHTFGTVMAGKNTDIVEVAKMMGHKNYRFTLDHYAHGMGKQREMMERAWDGVLPQGQEQRGG